MKQFKPFLNFTQNEIVVYKNKTYKCLKSHNSSYESQKPDGRDGNFYWKEIKIRKAYKIIVDFLGNIKNKLTSISS